MTKANPNILPDELVWADGGHLSEIALGALGDGQLEIVPENARNHATTCEACALQMGRAALLSSALDEALQAAPLLPANERAPVPWLAIVAAFMVAAVGSVASLLQAPGGIASAPSTFAREAPLAFHALTALLRGIANGAGPALTFGGAAILFAAGALVARSMPRTWAEPKT